MSDHQQGDLATDPMSFALQQTDPRDWAPELQKSRIYEQLL